MSRLGRSVARDIDWYVDLLWGRLHRPVDHRIWDWIYEMLVRLPR